MNNVVDWINNIKIVVGFVNRLNHVAIRVKDMNRAVSYYVSLGFNCEWESDDWSYFEEGIALLGPQYNRADPYFAIRLNSHDDLRNKWQELMDNGFECCRPHKHRDGTVSFYTRDTEGNQLEFIFVSD